MNIQKGITAMLFAVMIASVLALTVSAASATSLFLGPYELQHWDKSGPGTTSITPMSGAACSATFSYNHTPSSYNLEAWQFNTTAAQTETLSFDWEYTGCHSWYHSEAQAYVFADGPSGRTITPLYDGYGGCYFTHSGSSSIQVNNGYSFGFIVKGEHYDYSEILRGSLTISTPDTTPPVINCSGDVTVEQETADGTVVPLTATANDTCDADPTITSDELAIYPLGTTVVTFTATDDSGNSASCSMTVTVVDTTAPVIICPANVTVEQESADGTVVPLTATATATDICDADVSITSDAPAVFPLGTTTVTLTATDDSGNSASCSMTVTVEDTTAPDISVTVSPDMLWPPNHKMVDIVATVTVSDICDAAPVVVLTSVTSDEPDDAKGNGDGKTVEDIQAEIGTGDYEFQLRAERAGKGDGRTYTITYTVTDASGNNADASATVVVPHDIE